MLEKEAARRLKERKGRGGGGTLGEGQRNGVKRKGDWGQREREERDERGCAPAATLSGTHMHFL